MPDELKNFASSKIAKVIEHSQGCVSQAAWFSTIVHERFLTVFFDVCATNDNDINLYLKSVESVIKLCIKIDLDFVDTSTSV